MSEPLIYTDGAWFHWWAQY